MERESEFGNLIYGALLQRIKERRTRISDVIRFLETGNSDPLHSCFVPVAEETIITFVIKFAKRCNIDVAFEGTETTNEVPTTFEERLKSNLEKYFKKTTVLTLDDKIRSEIRLIKNVGSGSNFIKKIIDALNAIPPTSVETERCFFITGQFCRKERQKLSNQAMNTLLFLNKYYLRTE